MKDKTISIHGGKAVDLYAGAVTMPLFHSSVYLLDNEEDFRDIRYPRLCTTPNLMHIGQKLADLDGTEAGVVFSSGMGAITASLLAAVPKGGHLLIQDQLYGGTHHMLKDNIEEMGRSYTTFSHDEPTPLEDLLRPETKAIYVEGCSNPCLLIPDFNRILNFAKKHNLVTMIDNTFMSPVNFKPAKLGFDIVLHSATKYLNGHSDVIAGVALGSEKWIRKIKDQIIVLGSNLDAHSCFLLDRGLKTLPIRIKEHNASALKIAQFLEKQPKIQKVYYPGLESHPHHQRAKEFFQGFGGMLAFDYDGSADQTEAFMKRLKIPWIAPSLGGVESLISRCASAAHKALSPEERAKTGVGESLIRLSVGLEDVDDLIEDFKQALAGS